METIPSGPLKSITEVEWVKEQNLNPKRCLWRGRRGKALTGALGRRDGEARRPTQAEMRSTESGAGGGGVALSSLTLAL